MKKKAENYITQQRALNLIKLIKQEGWEDLIAIYQEQKELIITETMQCKRTEDLWQKKGELQAWEYAEKIIYNYIESYRQTNKGE